MKRGGRRATPGSFAGVIAAYIGSDKFMRLAASTQGNYRRHLALAQSVLGARDVEVMRPALTQAFLDGLSDRPATQKVAQTALKALERWAIRLDLLPRQITLGTEAVGSKGGHKPWTEDQIRTAIDHARADLSRVVMVASNTGQRGSDLVKMRWSDLETYEGRLGLNVVTKKVGLQLWIPLTLELSEALTTWERRPGFILLKPDGQPWSRTQLSDAWTKERDTNPALASLEGCTLHGLRSTAIVRLRRAGVSTGLISSLVGLSENMVNRYCRFAVQKDNAIAAVIQLDGTARERNKSNRNKVSR
jgi:integrase